MLILCTFSVAIVLSQTGFVQRTAKQVLDSQLACPVDEVSQVQ